MHVVKMLIILGCLFMRGSRSGYWGSRPPPLCEKHKAADYLQKYKANYVGNIFWGYEDFVDIFLGSPQNLTIFRGHFYAF